jgi:hypothetical protein
VRLELVDQPVAKQFPFLSVEQSMVSQSEEKSSHASRISNPTFLFVNQVNVITYFDIRT